MTFCLRGKKKGRCKCLQLVSTEKTLRSSLTIDAFILLIPEICREYSSVQSLSTAAFFAVTKCTVLSLLVADRTLMLAGNREDVRALY